jgi:hypothetical protein
VLYNPYTKGTICLLAFFWAAIRYLCVRWELSGIIDPPDYLDTIHEHSELCITMMGYGQFEDIAAPYALRYMWLRTFFPMVFGRWPITWFVGSWPRRFTDGFQRLWERVSWRIDALIHIKLTRRRRGSRNGIADFPSKCYLGLFSS